MAAPGPPWLRHKSCPEPLFIYSRIMKPGRAPRIWPQCAFLQAQKRHCPGSPPQKWPVAPNMWPVFPGGLVTILARDAPIGPSCGPVCASNLARTRCANNLARKVGHVFGADGPDSWRNMCIKNPYAPIIRTALRSRFLARSPGVHQEPVCAKNADRLAVQILGAAAGRRREHSSNTPLRSLCGRTRHREHGSRTSLPSLCGRAVIVVVIDDDDDDDDNAPPP